MACSPPLTATYISVLLSDEGGPGGSGQRHQLVATGEDQVDTTGKGCVVVRQPLHPTRIKSIDANPALLADTRPLKHQLTALFTAVFTTLCIQTAHLHDDRG